METKSFVGLTPKLVLTGMIFFAVHVCVIKVFNRSKKAYEIDSLCIFIFCLVFGYARNMLSYLTRRQFFMTEI